MWPYFFTGTTFRLVVNMLSFDWAKNVSTRWQDGESTTRDRGMAKWQNGKRTRYDGDMARILAEMERW